MNFNPKFLSLCCCHIKDAPSLLKLMEKNLNNSFHQLPEEFSIRIYNLKDPELLDDLFWLMDNPRELKMNFHGDMIPMEEIFSRVDGVNVFVTKVYKYPRKGVRPKESQVKREKVHLRIV